MTHTRLSPLGLLLRLLLLVFGSVAVVALLLAGALFTLDDADYKRVLVWATDTFLDSELKISGPFSVRLSDGIHVTAGDVLLSAYDGSYSITTQQFSTDFRVISLLSGALVVNNVILTDTYLRINETESGSPLDFSLPPLVVARAHFRSLTLEYQELRPGTLHSFFLNDLMVGSENDAESLGIRANGLFQGQAYQLSGTLPSLADMLERDSPHPVAVQFSSEHITASLEGQVADFVRGEGLDLEMELHAEDVQDILEIFADGIPRIGDVDATARLRGDYDSPGLDGINISFHRDEEVAIRVTGSVDDVVTGKGLDLDISGHSSRPAVASWLLFGKLDRISSVSLDTKLLAQYGRIQLHDLKASATTSDGLALAASGSAELYDTGHVFARKDKGLTVRFTAPTTAAFNLLDYKNIPELGAVDGTARLLASRDAIGIYDAEIRIGNQQGQQSLVEGSIARIGLVDKAAVTGIDLQAKLRIPNVADLAKQIGYDLPEMGQGSVNLSASGNLNKVRLSNVNIRLGNTDTLLVTARGAADRLDLAAQSLPQTADFSVTATAARLVEISNLAGLDLPELGRTQATGQLQLRGNKLLFEPLKVDIGAADQPEIRLTGKATTVLHKGSSVDVRFDVAATDLLMTFTDLKPGYLGRLQGMLDISSMEGNWSIEKFRLTSTQTQLYRIDIAGEKEDFSKMGLVSVKSAISIKDPAKFGDALNMDLSGFSPWAMTGVLSTRADTLSYHATGTLGSTTSTTVIHGHLKNGKPYFKGKTDIPVLHLKDLGLGKNTRQPGVRTVSDNSDRTYIFSRKPLDVSFLKRFDMDFDLLIDQVESEGQLTIDRVNGKVNVLDGRLSLSPLKLVFEDGRMDISFDVDAGNVPAYQLQVTGDDIVLGPLLAQVQDDVPITGYSNIDLDLKGSGRSPHELASSLSGNLSIGFENARIPSEYIDLLSVDVFGWVFSKTRKKESYSDLNCVVVAFDVNEGKLKSRTLIADGPNLTVAGHINLDLGAETMDILLIPKQKTRIFSSIEPVKIKGPIMDPKVEAVPVKAAIQEAGAMVLLPTVVIPVRLLGKLWSILDDDDKPGQGCASLKTVTEAAEKKQQK
jgi:hypothetical protein